MQDELVHCGDRKYQLLARFRTLGSLFTLLHARATACALASGGAPGTVVRPRPPRFASVLYLAPVLEGAA